MQQVCKPGSVLFLQRVSIINLRAMLPLFFSILPSNLGEQPSHVLMKEHTSLVYLNLQPISTACTECYHSAGGLLPRLFTLALRRFVFCSV